MKATAWAILIVFGLMFAAVLLPEQKAYACSCASSGSLEKLERFAAVFTGTVISAGGTKRFAHDTSRKYTFQVDTAWKGVSDPRVSVYSRKGEEASCGYSFSRGKTYLVFAYEDEGVMKTDFCGGNLLIGQAASELEQLGPGMKIERTGGLIPFPGGGKSAWLGPSAGAAALLVLFVFLRSWRRKNRG